MVNSWMKYCKITNFKKFQKLLIEKFLLKKKSKNSLKLQNFEICEIFNLLVWFLQKLSNEIGQVYIYVLKLHKLYETSKIEEIAHIFKKCRVKILEIFVIKKNCWKTSKKYNSKLGKIVNIEIEKKFLKFRLNYKIMEFSTCSLILFFFNYRMKITYEDFACPKRGEIAKLNDFPGINSREQLFSKKFFFSSINFENWDCFNSLHSCKIWLIWFDFFRKNAHRAKNFKLEKI